MPFRGAVFSYRVKCVAVRFLPNRTVPYDIAFNKTAPNRTIGFFKIEIRTAPILKNKIRTKPHILSFKKM